MNQSNRHVGLLGAAPSYRRGLRSLLEDLGWDVELLDTAETDEVLAAVLVHDEPGSVEATRTTAAVHETVITLLPDPIAEDHVACVRAGATAVIDAHAEPEDIAAVLEAATSDQVLIPRTTFQRLVAIARSNPGDIQLAPTEVNWLGQLADGSHVRDIARQGHFSERSAHRALTQLYSRIGVDNRDQAIAWASRHGLLD